MGFLCSFEPDLAVLPGTQAPAAASRGLDHSCACVSMVLTPGVGVLSIRRLGASTFFFK